MNAMLKPEKKQTTSKNGRIQDAFHGTDEWLRWVFEQSTLGMAISDNTFKFTAANPAFCAMLGYTEAELTKLTFKDITHPDHLRQDTGSIMKLAAGEIQSYKTEKRYITKSGTVLYGSLTVSALHDASGSHMHSLVVLEDITQRKRLEEALLESESRFRKIVEQAPIAMAVVGMDGAIEFINKKAVKVFGYPPEDIPTMERWWVQAYPDDAYRKEVTADWMGRIQKALTAGGEIAGNEYRVTCKDGSIKIMFISGVPVADKIFVLFDDITQSKKSEEALAAEKERLAVTLRSIGDGVIATDVHGNIVLMNKVAEDLTGWRLSEATGKPLTGIFTVADALTRERLENTVEKVLSSGNSIELAGHALLISRGGTERIIADSGAPIKDNANNVIGVVLVFRDITEKQKFMDAVQRTAKLDSLGILAGGIAHDFNNLLTGIYGYMDLARSVSTDPHVTENYEKMLATMKRAKALTLQLLTFAKGGSPVQKITPLTPFIQETARFALSGSNISCSFSLAQDLRPCNIDKDQIAQVIDNIVINAQQAMPDGGTIEITAVNLSFGENEHPPLLKGDYVKVSIKDSGIGIPKEIMHRIFDPFYTTKLKGHGLGLATSYSIVNRHGGCIDVDSQPGKGSVFHVYLPASSQTVAAQATAAGTHKGSGTIIVMDDEEVVRDTFQQMLESLGYTVVCKNNGKEAVDFFVSETARRRCIALILDLTVPGAMGGKEAVAEIRKLDKTIPVFVASGYADNSVMKNPAAYGFTASIAKPFTIAELTDILNTYLTQSTIH